MTTAGKLNYHFDQVGSYLRPNNLKEAREQYADGEITADALREVCSYTKKMDNFYSVRKMKV
ncbi:MAG: hypothetical protein ACTJFB_00140 [Leuconostoc falkenbergense]